MRKLVWIRLFDLAADQVGSVLVETTLMFPMMATLTFGLITLGFLMNNYVTLASATSTAARQFALDAPIATTSVSATPYTDLQSQLSATVFAQATGGITITSVCVYPAASGCGANTCNSDASCSSVLASGQNDVVTVQTSYPCFVAIPLLGLNACTLTASASAEIQ